MGVGAAVLHQRLNAAEHLRNDQIDQSGQDQQQNDFREQNRQNAGKPFPAVLPALPVKPLPQREKQPVFHEIHHRGEQIADHKTPDERRENRGQPVEGVAQNGDVRDGKVKQKRRRNDKKCGKAPVQVCFVPFKAPSHGRLLSGSVNAVSARQYPIFYYSAPRPSSFLPRGFGPAAVRGKEII